MFGVAIDENVYKVGKIIVMLLIIIAVVVWISGVLGSPILNYRY
jgi:low affinity Fe/Cu permease